jgi:phosphoglycolate phosphatase
VINTPFDAAVFDFDGTLVGSAAAKRMAFFDIFPHEAAAIVEAVLADDPDGSRYRVIPRMIELARGQGVVLPDVDYVARYGEVAEHRVAAAPELPGATTLLGRLASVLELHICSNTPRDSVRRHVAARGWSGCFKSVEGYPTTKRELIASVIASRRLQPSRVAMVGDSVSDREAAAANGCAFFAIAVPEDLLRASKSLEGTHV